MEHSTKRNHLLPAYAQRHSNFDKLVTCTFKKCTANSAWNPSPISTSAWSGLFRRSLILKMFPYRENKLKSLSSSIFWKAICSQVQIIKKSIKLSTNNNVFAVLTSGFKLETRTVHLSLVPLIPGGKPPPKAAAIAAALAIYKKIQFKKNWLAREHNHRRNNQKTSND